MPRLKLLGTVVLEDEDGLVEGAVARRHPLALLALLACAPDRAVSRSKLVGLLWPEIPEDRARTRLNTHLYQIRRRLGEAVVESAGDQLRLDRDALVCDVHRFREAMEAGRFERAVELYEGPFLDGFRPPDAPAFEKWADRERDRRRQAYRDALEALAEREEARGEPAAAAGWWRKRATEDPYDSRVLRRLMEALAAAGNRAAALRVARTHARLLEEELGTEPDAEVQRLVERLEAGEEEAPAAAAGPGPEGPDEGRPGPEPTEADRPRSLDRGPRGGGDVSAATGGDHGARAKDGTGGGSGGWRGYLRAPPFPLRWGLVGLGLVAVAAVGGWYLTSAGGPEPTHASLAVLPFDNLSDPDDAYFAAGVHEEILTQLAKVGGIKLISRTSVLRYEDTGKSLPEIAEELGVSTILEGTVQRVGDEVRIAVQLNDARADEHLWAESYDRQLSDIFRIQTDVATRVVKELKGVLTPQERAELARRPTDDMEAYAHYLRGHQHFWKLFSEQETRAAAEAYERAAELDPGFAAAWSRLVQARTWLAWIWGEYDERARARTALGRLESVAPGSAELRLARGIWLYYGVQRYEDALREFEVLADLWPGDIGVTAYRGALYRRLGRWDEAVQTWERLLELDPANASIAFTLGEAYTTMRRFEEAERYFKRAVALDPTVPVHWWGLVFTRVTRGDMTAARAAVDTARRRLDEEDWENGGWWARWQVYTGGTDEVLELYRELYREATFIDGTWYLSWDLGLAAAAAGGRSEIVQAYADTLRVQAERALTSVPADYVSVRGLALSQLALAHAYLGNEETAVRTARQAVQRFPVSRDATWGGHRVLTEAHVYTVVGHHDQAVDRLRYLLSIPAGGVSVPLLRLDPRWDPLRHHSGFQELLREMDPPDT